MQPWASAIVDGPKRIENRTWRPFQLRDGPFAIWIHASAKPDRDAIELPTPALWHWIEGRDRWSADTLPDWGLPCGAIIGAAVVEDVRDGLDRLPDGQEDNWADDTDGDGLINALDPDSGGDGLLDGTERGITTPGPGTDVERGHFVADADPTTTTSMMKKRGIRIVAACSSPPLTPRPTTTTLAAMNSASSISMYQRDCIGISPWRMWWTFCTPNGTKTGCAHC
jgi:hypothetical protein